jgi:hypothetical protein
MLPALQEQHLDCALQRQRLRVKAHATQLLQGVPLVYPRLPVATPTPQQGVLLGGLGGGGGVGGG